VTEWADRSVAARRRLAWRAAGVLAIAVVAIVAVGALSSRQHAEASARHRREFNAEIARLEQFVAARRELSFTKPVKVELLPSAQFEAAAQSDVGYWRDYLVGLYPYLHPLSLSTGPSDPTSIGQLAADSEQGFYDDVAKTVFVRGTRIDPYTQRVLVHELTHALDDQHFDFSQLFARSRHWLELKALVEGDARRIENEFIATLEPADRARSLPAAGQATLTTLPVAPDIRALFAFPYLEGSRFVSALAAHGGEQAVDAEFKDPPRYASEVLHPAYDYSVEQRVNQELTYVLVGTPKPIGRVLSGPDGPVTFGEYFTRLFLTPTLGAHVAERAAAGWSGDVGITWNDGSRNCVRIAYRATAANGALFSALRTWASRHPGARWDSPYLTACA
jgi:hypothetical protein